MGEKSYFNIDPVSKVIDMSFLKSFDSPSFIFKNLQEAIDNFLSSNNNSTITINIKVKIVNSVTMSEIYKMFKKFKQYNNNNIKFIFNWYYFYDEEELLTFGKDLEFLCDLKFNFIPYQE